MNLEELSDDELNALDRRTEHDLEATEAELTRLEDEGDQDEYRRVDQGYEELQQLVLASHAERMRRRG